MNKTKIMYIYIYIYNYTGLNILNKNRPYTFIDGKIFDRYDDEICFIESVVMVENDTNLLPNPDLKRNEGKMMVC